MSHHQRKVSRPLGRQLRSYLSDYNPSDFDYDIPLFMTDSEEGDVPPNTLALDMLPALG